MHPDAQTGSERYCPRCGRSYAGISRCPDDGDALIQWRAPRDPVIGSVLDQRYRIVHKIGEGAMGVVYEAIQLSVDRPVAIKVIRDELIADPASARRFLREARMLTSTSHPNIVDVFDLGQTAEGALFLVMELLHGETLAAQLAGGRRFPPRRVIELGIQLCDALAAAHERGIVHRDLKPANVVTIAALGDFVKVLDFGLAKSLAGVGPVGGDTVTQAGTIMGTPMYMAPEAIGGDAAEPRTDLYALGCILHEMLVGAPPFADPIVSVVLARHLHDIPAPLPRDVPSPLAALVLSLLAKLPSSRPAGALDVRARLAALRERLPGPDEPTVLAAPIMVDAARPTLPRMPRGSQPPPLAAAPRSYTWLVALVLGGLFGLAVALLVLLVT